MPGRPLLASRPRRTSPPAPPPAPLRKRRGVSAGLAIPELLPPSPQADRERTGECGVRPLRWWRRGAMATSTGRHHRRNASQRAVDVVQDLSSGSEPPEALRPRTRAQSIASAMVGSRRIVRASGFEISSNCSPSARHPIDSSRLRGRASCSSASEDRRGPGSARGAAKRRARAGLAWYRETSDTPLRLRRGAGGEVFRRCRKAQSASRSWYEV